MVQRYQFYCKATLMNKQNGRLQLFLARHIDKISKFMCSFGLQNQPIMHTAFYG